MIRSNILYVVLFVVVWGCAPVVNAEGPGDEVPGRFDEYELLILDRPRLSLMKQQAIKFPGGPV